MSNTNELLHRALRPIAKYFDREDVEELAANREGEIWLKTSQGWIAEPDPEIRYKFTVATCRFIANLTEQKFDKDVLPILAATLPGGHRFQAVVGPNVRYEIDDTEGMCFCVRLFKKDKKFKLEDYRLEPGQGLKKTEKQGMVQKRYSDTPYEDLVGAMEHGEAVLISGATATGKTTFLNALVDFIPPDRRIITVEDVREVLLPNHVNRVHLVVSRTDAANKVDYPQILDSVVRLTPDAIICGEISISNSKSIYRLMTTGHSNFMATIHAESPEMALRAFWQNLTQTGENIDPKAAIDIISSSFGRVIQIDRTSGDRIVTGVELPGMIKEIISDEARKTGHA